MPRSGEFICRQMLHSFTPGAATLIEFWMLFGYKVTKASLAFLRSRRSEMRPLLQLAALAALFASSSARGAVPHVDRTLRHLETSENICTQSKTASPPLRPAPGGLKFKFGIGAGPLSMRLRVICRSLLQTLNTDPVINPTAYPSFPWCK